MDVDQYISSGILELYIAGALREDESIEVFRNINKYSKVKVEVNRIEKTFIDIAVNIAPKINSTAKVKHKTELLNAILKSKL